MSDLHLGGATIWMVTHHPRFARQAERTIHLFDGRTAPAALAEAADECPAS